MLILAHNGKTGGSTLRTYFRKDARIYEIHGTVTYIDIERLLTSDIISLHETNFTFTEEISNILASREIQCDVMATIRNPVRLLQSYWNFSIARNSHASLPHIPNSVRINESKRKVLENFVTAKEKLTLQDVISILDDERLLNQIYQKKDLPGLGILRFLLTPNRQTSKIRDYTQHITNNEKLSSRTHLIPTENIPDSLASYLLKSSNPYAYFDASLIDRLRHNEAAESIFELHVNRTSDILQKNVPLSDSIDQIHALKYNLHNHIDYMTWYGNISSLTEV